MNSLMILTVFAFLAVGQTAILAEQLFHREGRFIDLTLHRYKTQLPSIHDIANTFIHYRMPVAVFVPTVRFNIRQRQKRTHFANFPSSPKNFPNQSEALTNNNKVTQNADPEIISEKASKNQPQPIISRNGWTARSLNKPKSFNPLANYNYKIRSRNNGPIYQSLNYATQLPSESNVDLMPFLYKENLPAQSSSLFNSPYQLTNSNPGQMFAQNIAYIQPNSLAPFQPNILLLTAPERSVATKDQKKVTEETQSVNDDRQKNITASTTVSIVPGLNSTTTVNAVNRNATETVANSTGFDVSQVGDNPDEIVQEHVQNHEPVENVPVNLVEEQSVSGDGAPISNSSISTISNEIIANNSTTLIDQPRISEQDKSQLEVVQPIAMPIVANQPIGLKNSDLVNELTLVDPYRTNNIVKRFYSYPISAISSNQIKPKNKLMITGRAHRSLPIDMPSYAGLLTAAVAQSGHSRDNRRKSFARFMNDNLN